MWLNPISTYLDRGYCFIPAGLDILFPPVFSPSSFFSSFLPPSLLFFFPSSLFFPLILLLSPPLSLSFLFPIFLNFFLFRFLLSPPPFSYTHLPLPPPLYVYSPFFSSPFLPHSQCSSLFLRNPPIQPHSLPLLITL